MTDSSLVRSLARELVRAVRQGALKGEPGTDAGMDAHSVLPSGSTFLRGLSIGALVGAAIAGSAIWDRRRARRPRGP